MKSYQQLFAELKRRKVFKVAAVYGATAFVLLQVADILGEGLRLPDSFLPFITAVILVGFPLALVLAWAFEVTPEGVQKTSAASPGEIEELVGQPAARRWPAGLLALAGIAALIAGVWWVGARGGGTAETTGASRADSLQLALSPASDDGRPSIAVLPFADMSPEGDQQYFSDGMTEEILNTLARVRELKVAARTSAFAFRGAELDMRAIGDSLDVAYLIEGSVRKSGENLRITTQLIDAADGTHLWSEQYDRTMDDVFAIQSEIAAAIADALRIPLGLDEARDLVTPTDDLEAYDLYLAGRARIRERGPGLREARRLFGAAIARDSSWAPAWAGLAEASELSIWYPPSWDLPPDSTSSREAIVAENLAYVDDLQDDAVRAAERAIDLDPRNASAYVALGSVNRNRRSWEASEQAYLSALRLDPDNAEAHQQYAEMLSNRGRLPEALAHGRRALDLDRAPIRFMQQASALAANDQPERALAALAELMALDEDGDIPQARWLWQRLCAKLGRYDEMFIHGSAGPLSRADMDSTVQAFEAGDIARLPAAYRTYYPLGPDLLYLRTGRSDLALASIERIAREWSYGNFGVFWMPEYDSIRRDPKFQEVLRQANLDDVELQRTSDSEAAP